MEGSLNVKSWKVFWGPSREGKPTEEADYYFYFMYLFKVLYMKKVNKNHINSVD